MHSVLRETVDELEVTFVRILAYLGAVAAIAIVCGQVVLNSVGLTSAPPRPQTEWIDVERPFPAFSLTMPELDPPDGNYSILRHAATGGRKDIISFGDFAGARAALNIEIYRPGTELARFADPTSEIAARSADMVRIGPVLSSGELHTKFGSIMLADFVVQGSSGPRACLGFAHAYDDPLLQVSGWYCNTGGEIVDRGLVACALDRLTLVAAGSDPKIAELFARAEVNRNFCGRTPLLASPRSRSWIDGSDLKLRGRIVAR